MAPSSSVIHLRRGDILYREGDPNDAAYIIAEGNVILHRQAAGQRLDIEIRGKGAVIGEFSILTESPRTVTVEAQMDCQILRLPAEKIFERFERLDPILKACVETSIGFTAKLNSHLAGTQQTCAMACHAPPIPTDLVDLLRLGGDIQPGLDRGEFSMVYQPIVQLSDSRIKGFEALMRWSHPVLGNVPPDRFITVAEELEVIAALTEFALSEACGTLRQMHVTGPRDAEHFMSVNVSGVDVGRNGFPDFVSHVLDRNSLEPHHLRLEVTETSLVPSSEIARDNLDRLQHLGVGISIDDFGTGYSNLGYLKYLPLTALKIDRAFAGDAHCNSISQSIVRMLVALGRELDVDVVAEGLEKPETVETLRNLGCCLAQGYHFFRPLAVSDAISLVTEGLGARQRPA